MQTAFLDYAASTARSQWAGRFSASRRLRADSRSRLIPEFSKQAWVRTASTGPIRSLPQNCRPAVKFAKITSAAVTGMHHSSQFLLPFLREPGQIRGALGRLAGIPFEGPLFTISILR